MKEYHLYFKRKHRPNGDWFTLLSIDAPEELKQLVNNIHLKHFDCLPNDWIYEQISNAFGELEHDKLEDITIESDCYNSGLYKWLAETYATTFIEEFAEENGSCNDIYHMIGAGQQLAKQRIYDLVNEFLEAHVNDEQK